MFDTGKRIVETAIDNGATLAGIASMDALRSSPSHTIYPEMGNYAGIGTFKGRDALPRSQWFNWPNTVRSVLVIGLSHPRHRPELDWWDGKGTSGNRLLIDIAKRTRQQIENFLQVATANLHYYVENGGVFLKDAAVLAGLGCIGKNNMLVTPTCGPRIRLRALALKAEIEPTGPVVFDPCADCEIYCRKVCPENAMGRKASVFDSIPTATLLPARDGAYDRQRCNIRMEKDASKSELDGPGISTPIRYCRKCEFACPVGR